MCMKIEIVELAKYREDRHEARRAFSSSAKQYVNRRLNKEGQNGQNAVPPAKHHLASLASDALENGTSSYFMK